MRSCGVAIVILLLGCATAPAVFDSGNDLYRYCTAKGSGNGLLCLGLVTGYLEGLRLSFDCGKLDGVTREQLKDVVVKFLRDNPAERHLPAVMLASRPYYLAFKCQKSQ